jgi:hypothetical protein
MNGPPRAGNKRGRARSVGRECAGLLVFSCLVALLWILWRFLAPRMNGRFTISSQIPHNLLSNHLTLDAMKLLRLIITIVCLVATFIANAGEQLTTKAKCVVNQPTNAELQLLQGTWEGVLAGDKAHQKITITITGNSLHFHRDTNFWFETTITLPAAKDPKQLRTPENSTSTEEYAATQNQMNRKRLL